MALQEREYPTVLKLKQIEKEMATAINEYKYLSNTHMDEMKAEVAAYGLRSIPAQGAIIYYREMMQAQINILKGLVEQAKPLLANILAKGEMNQDVVSFKQKDLQELNSNLQTEADKLSTLEEELATAERENEFAELQQGSAFLQSVFMSLLAVIVIGLTVNAVVNPKSTGIENAILVIVVALIAYYLYNKYA